MAKTTSRLNSAAMKPPRRQASLDHLVGFMDPTHHQNVLTAAKVPPKATADSRAGRAR